MSLEKYMEERNVFTTLLASLYIQNHPDRMGHTGSKLELLQWAHGMGLITGKEAGYYGRHAPGFVTPRPFEVTMCCHGTPALEICDTSPALHAFIYRVLSCNITAHPHYQIHSAAGAFFQSGSDREDGFVLIEFWKPAGAKAFVDYINKHAGGM